MLSAGCHLPGYWGDFACRCTLDGLPCEGSLALCEGYSFLRRCIDGTWQVEDCGAASVSPSKIGLCVVGVEEKPASCDFWEPAP